MTLRRLAGDTAIYGMGYILGKVLNYLLITVYLTWKFDGEEAQYGLYTDFYFYVALILVLLTLRMETTFFRFATERDQSKTVYDQASMLLMGTSLLWIVVVLFFRDNIASFLEYPGYEKHVVVLGIIIALDVLVAVPFASLRLDQRPVKFAMLKVGGIVLNIIAVLFFLEILPRLAQAGNSWAAGIYDRDDRLFYVFVANLIGSGAVFLLFIPRYLRLSFQWNPVFVRKMLRYTLPLVVVGLAGVINQSSYITFQKYVLPNTLTQNLAEGGIYAAATRIAILMSLFITAFNYAAEPFFFQQAKSGNGRKIYADVALAFTIGACVLMAGILLYIDVIQLILGRSFREGLYVVPILLMAFYCLGLYYNFSIWYKLTDRTMYGALISSLGAIITIGLNIVLIARIGIEGSAWAALATYGFMATACYILGRKYFPVPYDLRKIALLLVLTLAAYGGSEVVRHSFPDQLGIVILLNTLIFGIFAIVLFRVEKHTILSVVRRNYGSHG